MAGKVVGIMEMKVQINGGMCYRGDLVGGSRPFTAELAEVREWTKEQNSVLSAVSFFFNRRANREDRLQALFG